ncbi:Normal oxygen consumption protein [Kalmusia sp. IMI 367209]|nr:Normal oxygen consumption protein [Kalmusia sp. IMI 367209]
MPRQRGGAAPRRPTAAPARPAAPAPAPARHSSTAAHPPAQQQAPPMQQAPAPQASQGPGLFGQMASTAAGVAVGSSIGHAIGGFFSGGSSSAPAEQSPQNTDFAQQHQQAQTQYSQQTGPCAGDVQNFSKCMNENNGNLTICGWYLDQLKACQQAASQY